MHENQFHEIDIQSVEKCTRISFFRVIKNVRSRCEKLTNSWPPNKMQDSRSSAFNVIDISNRRLSWTKAETTQTQAMLRRRKKTII
ncbi:CLUMA_CG020455, isoform A [Clunio marinus]|uniref:CLUMA_CG020455, isoform A n=1 Tax=Clunio marinus TaxID=568069 RepID=A0A1J1J521_9DIPT|nr:CLUMA_CG020455, isoform A [Clunio marinus]